MCGHLNYVAILDEPSPWLEPFSLRSLTGHYLIAASVAEIGGMRLDMPILTPIGGAAGPDRFHQVRISSGID